MTAPVMPFPMGFAEALARVAAHGTIEKDGVLVGCWWVSGVVGCPSRSETILTLDVIGLLRRRNSAVGAGARVPVDGDCNKAIREALASTSGRFACSMFGSILFEAMKVAEGATDPYCQRLDAREAVRAAARLAGTPPAEAADMARAALASMRSAPAAFLDAVDPRIVALLAEMEPAHRFGPDAELHWALGKTWPLLDPAHSGEAPLLDAMLRHPSLAPPLMEAAAADPEGFRLDTQAGRLSAILARHHASKGVLPHGAGLGLPALDDAIVASTGSGGRPIVDWKLPGPERRGRLPLPVQVMVTAASLPGNWLPKDRASWRALADMRPALDDACRRAPEGDRAAYLDVRGDWPAFRGRMLRTVGEVRLQDALDDVDDLLTGFGQHVVLPCLENEDTPNPGYVPVDTIRRVARHVISDGRTLPTLLTTSREWHHRRHSILAVVAGLPGRKAACNVPWPAALPDWSCGMLALKVLTTTAALVAEGGRYVDDDGVEGLAHCAGGYGDACRMGASRVASIREVAGDGMGRRLATVEFRFMRDGGRLFPWAAQVRGHGNRDAGTMCRMFVEDYLEAVRGGQPPFDPVGLDPVFTPSRSGKGGSDDPRDVNAAGYDWRHGDNWERVLTAWAPCLPAPLRHGTRAGYARACIEAMALDPKTKRRPRPVDVR